MAAADGDVLTFIPQPKREIVELSSSEVEEDKEEINDKKKKQKVVLRSSVQEEEKQIEIPLDDIYIHTLADYLKECELHSIEREYIQQQPTNIMFFAFIDQLLGKVPDAIAKNFPNENENPFFGMSTVIHHASHALGIPPDSLYRYCVLSRHDDLAQEEVKFLSLASRDTVFEPVMVRDLYDTFASTYAKNFKMFNEAIYVKTIHLLLWALGNRRDVLRVNLGEYLYAEKTLKEAHLKNKLGIMCETTMLKKDMLRGKLESYGVFMFEVIARIADDNYTCVMSEIFSECMFFAVTTALDCLGESTLRLCAISIDYVIRVWWPYIRRYYLNNCRDSKYAFDSSSWTSLQIYVPKPTAYVTTSDFYDQLYSFIEKGLPDTFKARFTKVIVPEGQERLVSLFENVLE